MPCYYPLEAFYAEGVNSAGKRIVSFKRTDSVSGKPLLLPCGRCVGCRLERSRQWAVRCMHEKQLHMHSCFVTLTYDDEHLPHGGSLVKRDLQLFMKRLRKVKGAGVRFYACGEYGDQLQRPHYHLLLFNCVFADARPILKAKGGQQLFRSEELRGIWQFGHNFIGEVTFESCAYVARYILKKVNGALAADHYQVMTDCGELVDREPEFTVMSRRPGIGSTWFDRYSAGVYDHDSVVVNGKEAKPPRYYDVRYELLEAERFDFVRRERRRRALLRADDNTPDRRHVRELVTLKRMALFQVRS